MTTQGNVQPKVMPSALFKFNVRDAGTLIGLVIIVITFSFYRRYFLPSLIYSIYYSSPPSTELLRWV